MGLTALHIPSFTETEWNHHAASLAIELTSYTAELTSGHTVSVGSFEESVRDKILRIVRFAKNTLFLYEDNKLIKEPAAILTLAYTHDTLKKSVIAAEKALAATAPKDPIDIWIALAMGDTTFIDGALRDCEEMLAEYKK